MYDAYSKQTSEEMVRTIFMKKWPVQLNETVLNFFVGHRLSPTNQNRLTLKVSKFCVFVRFGWNLIWGLMNQKQHRICLKWLRPFFDLPTNHNRPIDVKLTPIPSRTIITIIFLLNRSDILVGHFGDRHLGKRHLGKRHLGKRHFESQIGNQKWKIKD